MIPLTIIAPCFECGEFAQYRYIQPSGEWGHTFCAKCLWRIANGINGAYPVNIRPLDLTDTELYQGQSYIPE